MVQKGMVLWLTGISGAGKSTIALRLKEKLKIQLQALEILDGDIVRDFFENDLGYTEKERILKVKRIGFAAKLLADHGVFVIVANIAPYAEVREFLRKNLNNYIQVYVKVSPEGAVSRDVKGLYKDYNNSKMENLIGVDDRYDIPKTPDLVVDTEQESVESSVSKILDYLEQKKVLRNV
jgi:adenylylsulfate kinase